jgi:hypothetical protein
MAVIRIGYIDDFGVGHIPLTQGKEALCDAHWFSILSLHNWSALYAPNNGRWYATRGDHKKGMQWMHRVVMGNPLALVDHKVRTATLDNREENLRLATYSQNGYNRTKMSNNTSGYKGAYWHRASGKYSSQITINGKLLHLGLFKTAVEAAAVYNFAAMRLHGEFAALNDLSYVEAN